MAYTNRSNRSNRTPFVLGEYVPVFLAYQLQDATGKAIQPAKKVQLRDYQNQGMLQTATVLIHEDGKIEFDKPVYELTNAADKMFALSVSVATEKRVKLNASNKNGTTTTTQAYATIDGNVFSTKEALELYLAAKYNAKPVKAPKAPAQPPVQPPVVEAPKA